MKEADKQAAVEAARKTISRKGFLLGGAGVLGATALLGTMPGVASAQQQDDINLLILNYALTLEHLEAKFYQDGLSKFGGSFDKPTRKALNRIRKHEANHVKFLVSVIEDEFGPNSDVPRLQYNFNQTAFANRANFLEIASLLENTGVSAYDGAIAFITVPGYLTAGATIATVEARHATYVDSLNGNPPFPLPYDEPAAPRDVSMTVKNTFVTSDPDEGPYGPYESYNDFEQRLPNSTQPSGGTMSASEIATLQEESTE